MARYDQYSHIDFPAYRFRPYPKMYYSIDGKTVLANNEEEEKGIVEDGWFDHPEKALHASELQRAEAIAKQAEKDAATARGQLEMIRKTLAPDTPEKAKPPTFVDPLATPDKTKAATPLPQPAPPEPAPKA